MPDRSSPTGRRLRAARASARPGGSDLSPPTRQSAGFTRPYTKLYRSEAAKAGSLQETSDALRPNIDYRSDALAWNVTESVLHVIHDGRGATLP